MVYRPNSVPTSQCDDKNLDNSKDVEKPKSLSNSLMAPEKSVGISVRSLDVPILAPILIPEDVFWAIPLAKEKPKTNRGSIKYLIIY